jgi:hypothetical protein
VQGDVLKECEAEAAARGFKVEESCAEVVRRYHKSAIRRRCMEAMRTESYSWFISEFTYRSTLENRVGR